jgi:hypothetical protein
MNLSRSMDVANSRRPNARSELKRPRAPTVRLTGATSEVNNAGTLAELVGHVSGLVQAKVEESSIS